MILINGERFNDAEFYNGEVIFKKTSNLKNDRNTIEMIFKDNRDITAVLFARQWLEDACPEVPCDLVMKYCPYERMDRGIEDQLFSMRYFAAILRRFNFENIYILDPHSNVCVEALENFNTAVHVLDLEAYIRKVIKDFKPDYICYPDKGARQKYTQVLKNIDIPVFYGNKVRDLKNNGKITSYELVDAPDLKNKKVLIIDDICCLGGTAYEAAKAMKMLGADKVAFYISHCEDGIFVGNILKKNNIVFNGKETSFTGEGYVIDKVYTADTMGLSKTHENIKVVTVEESENA